MSKKICNHPHGMDFLASFGFKRKVVYSFTALLVLFLIQNVVTYAGTEVESDEPQVDYSSDQPYLNAGALVVEVLADTSEGKKGHRYFYAGHEMLLPQIVTRVEKIKASGMRVGGDTIGSKVIVLHEENMKHEPLDKLKKVFTSKGIKVSSHLKKGLREKLLGYVEREAKQMKDAIRDPVTIRQPVNVPLIAKEFGQVSRSILKLDKNLREAPVESLDRIIKDYQSFLAKYEKQKEHRYYKMGEEMLQLLIKIRKSKTKSNDEENPLRDVPPKSKGEEPLRDVPPK